MKHPAQPSSRGCFLPIIYEDDEVLLLRKESGVPSLPHSPDETETAVGAALARCPSLSGVGRGPLEPGLLHRLDTGTSGLLLFAKIQSEFDRLAQAWKSGQVRKIYRALSADRGSLPGEIRWPLGHSAKSSKRMIALIPEMPQLARQIRGKPQPALTRVLRAERTPSGLLNLEIEIETGVMHQIRCHLAAAGCPLLGDKIYRGGESQRLWLHAWRLSFPLRDGARLTAQAALPEGWPG